jgi:serine/threonine protein kinase
MGFAMDFTDPSAFEQQILKLGLVTEEQLAEIHHENGDGMDLTHLIAALERKSYLTPWQRGKVLKGDFDGFFLGGYRILYKIQSGSFGRVFRADDPRDGRVVAVKVLRRRWSEDQQRIDLFLREGKVGLTLKHPNIVEVLAINRDPSSGQYYLVMEFVEGGNLREILQIRKKLTVAESLRIIEDAASGLTYAYSRGMTHRDIKLTNLLISSTGEAKLVDFGLAQFFSTLAKKEEEKVDRTVDYAGLERATGVKTGDVRSDIYFLGCVLYECLTGRSPIAMTRDKHARMRKERFEQVPPIHPNEIDGPPTVMSLVETMMALDPKERYQTPAQLLDAVKTMRREIENKSDKSNGRPPSRSVFIAERDEHLQDILRNGLKDQGYRVFLAGDPVRALDRFRLQPFDGLIVDARTTGEEGFRIFEHIVREAARKRLPCAAIVFLDDDQASWAARLSPSPCLAVMRGQEVTFKKVARKLKELMDVAHSPD